MKNFSTRWLVVAGLLAVGSMNCGGGDGDDTGKGGSTATGGRGGSSAGGKGGTAVAGSGGTAVAGSGGTAAAGTGGTAAGGAGGNTDGGTPGLTCPINTFDTTTESFAFDTYMNPGEQNLANAVDGGAVAVLSRSATAGDPTAGALEVQAPFSDYNQFINVARSFGTAALKNWTGAKLHVRVKVVSGLNPSASNPAGVQPYATSYNGVDGGTAGYNFKGAYQSLKDSNGWNEYVVDLAASGSFDPSKVVQYGVIVQTGDGVMGDGGINPAKPTTAVVQVDSFWIEGTCPTGGTGGSGGAGGGTAGAGGGTAGAAGGTAGAAGAAAGSGGHAGGAAGAAGGAAGAAGGAAGAAGGAAGAAGSTAGAGGTATAGAGGTATAGAGGNAGAAGA